MPIKCETPADPYSFVDEEMSMNGMRPTNNSPLDNRPASEGMTNCQVGSHSGMGTPNSTPPIMQHQGQHPALLGIPMMNGMNPQLAQPKKRGRKKKSEMILTPEE